jgi:hypothetical protein
MIHRISNLCIFRSIRNNNNSIQFFILTCWLNSYWRQLQSQQLYFASVPVTSSGTAVRLFCNPSTHRHNRNGTRRRQHLTCVARSLAYQVERLRMKLHTAFYEKVPAGGMCTAGWTTGLLLLVENSTTHQGDTLLHTDCNHLAVESSV